MIDKRRGGGGGFDSRQLPIDWNGVQNTPPVDSPAQAMVDAHAQRAASSRAAPGPIAADYRPVMRLRWDFRTRFPQVLPEVLDPGMMAAENALPENVEAIQLEHGRKMLGTLAELDAAKDERRSARANLASANADRIDKPTRLERWYASLLGVYEEWFGKESAEAFDHAVRAWHAHVEVVMDRDVAHSVDAALAPSTGPSPIGWESLHSPAALFSPEPCRALLPSMPLTRQLADLTPERVVARMPVPKALPAVVAAGHFGIDDRGKAINPSADEVYAITNELAEKLIDLIQSLPAPSRPGRSAVEDQITAGIAKYAESFGEHAAQRLDAYCRRQSRQRDNGPSHRGR